MANPWEVYKQRQQQTQEIIAKANSNPWTRYKLDRGVTESSFSKPITTPTADGAEKAPYSGNQKSIYQAANRIIAEAQASVGRQKTAMTGTELREAAANQAAAQKAANALELYANRGLTGTERREKQEDLIRAAQKAAAEEERQRTAGLTGTERLAPIRELKQQKKALEAEKADMYANPGNYIWAEALTGAERRERGSDYTQRSDIGLEMAKRGAEYDAKIAGIDQKMADFRSNAYRYITYEPDFRTFSQQGAEMRRPQERSTGDSEMDTYLEQIGAKAETANKGTFVNEAEHIDIMNFLNYEENSIYNYLLAKYGQDSADIYLDTIIDELNKRKGRNIANILKSHEGMARAVQTGGYALRSGLDQFGSGAVQAFSDEVRDVTPVQYGAQFAREDLADAGPKVLGSSLGQWAFDATQTVGNMLPSLILSMGTSASGAPVKLAQLMGAGAMGVSAGGNTYATAVREGMDPDAARVYARLVGTAAGLLQYAIGGIDKLSGGSGAKLAAKAAGIENGFLRFIATHGVNALSEAGEEALEAILEPLFKRIATGDDGDIDWSEVAYNALLGGMTGWLLGGNGETEATQGYATVENAIQGATSQRTSRFEDVGGGYLTQEHHGNILDGMRQHMDEIEVMEPVSALTGKEFQKSETDTRPLRAKVLEFFDSIGNKVFRKGMGDIALNNAGVHDSLGHGYGKLKAATFAALPNVLVNGRLISYDPSYQGRGYESYLIAAPVTVNNELCYVGAYVIKDINMQRYKVHEVLTIRKNGAESFKTETSKIGSDIRDNAPSNESVAQPKAEVNNGVTASESPGIYTAFLLRHAADAQGRSSVPAGKNGKYRRLYPEEALKRQKEASIGIYADFVKKAEAEKAQKIADKLGVKLVLRNFGANSRDIYESILRTMNNVHGGMKAGTESSEGRLQAERGHNKDMSATGGTVIEAFTTNATDGIINEKRAKNLKLTRRGEVINPMPTEEYNRIKSVLATQGVEVFAATSGDDLRYMLAIGAEGTYSNGRITHIGDIPSRGTMYEEIIHMVQARKNGELATTDYVELYKREIEANRKLLRHSKHYNLDEIDIGDIIRNLKAWEESFNKAMGVSYDDFINGK